MATTTKIHEGKEADLTTHFVSAPVKPNAYSISNYDLR